MSRLWLVDPLGERPLAAGDLPLSVGGAGADIVVPGCATGEVRARVDVDGERLRIERAGSGAAALDGVDIRLEEQDGRRCIVVGHGGVANLTLPPLHPGDDAGVDEGQGDRLPVAIVDYRPPGVRPRPRRQRAWPLRRAAGFAGLAIVAAVIAFLVASTTVTVTTSPATEPDSVDFRGAWLAPGFGGRYLLLPGDYTVELRAEGYAPASQPVSIARGPAQDVIVALERLPGLVAIDTGGLAATLVVDGVERGSLPGEVELAAGTRELLVSAPRHADEAIRLEVEGGGERQELSVRLTPLFAPVKVTSLPAGATVRVDGRELGRTPLETELEAGRYALALEHPRFRRFESQVTVRPGEPLEIGPVELGMPDGTLLLRSEPSGADVSIAGRYRGRTPLRVGLPPGMPQEVVVSRAGYAPVTRNVSVESRGERTLALELQAVIGELTVRGEPADAELWVDGVAQGPANQTLRLPAAPHVIEVRKAGLETFRATVTPREGQPQVVEYQLQSPREAKLARLPARAATALGQELILVNGGRFTLGSPRREPGRRSNETERLVELRRPFYLSKHQVTNAEFRQFRKEHMTGAFKDETLDLERMPAGRVSWQDAAAFCNWLSERDGLPPAYVRRGSELELADPVTTGYRLPTEAEWEYAARHDGRAATRRYPWGDELPVPPRAGNWADATALYLSPVIITGYDDGFRVAAPVGSFPANPLGFHDLGGNVYEWTTDRYSVYVVASDHVAVDPVGPRSGSGYVIRGASWLTGRVAELRTASRDSGSGGRQDLGFRIARYAE